MTAIFRETADLPAEREPSLLEQLRAQLDLADVLIGTGLAGLFVGLALAWLPLALAVVGAVLVVFGVLIALRRSAS